MGNAKAKDSPGQVYLDYFDDFSILTALLLEFGFPVKGYDYYNVLS